ncbi:MAG TPA: DUF4175 family protein [Vicinamibacterales bacterium]|nr:DUF4175 family protein [Vicinamibacterales bacterium]
MPGTDRLNALIAAVRRRWFMTVALRAAGTAMAAASAPLLGAIAVYWMFAPAGGALLALAAATTMLAGAAAAVVVRRIEPRPHDTRVARFIEERAEALPHGRPMDDCVVSAVQASTPGSADDRAPFAELVVGGALRRLEGIEAPALVPTSSIRQSALVGAGGAVLLLIAFVAGWPALIHTYETVQLALFPESISVEVLPGDARVVAGAPLTIRARLHAGGATLARAQPRLIVSAGSEERSVDMAANADGFEFTFESVDRTFRYKVAAGPVASADFTVTALFAPRVKRIDIQYQYPSFSGLAPRREEDGGDIYAPAGTRVRLHIHTDNAVASGELAMSTGTPPLRPAGDQLLEVDLVVARDDSYRIRLLDRDGLASDGDSEYFIRLMDDRPPDVRIVRPSADQGITPLEEVAIEARAEDDYGVASFDLVYSVAGGKEHVVPFSNLTGTDTQRTGAHLLAAEELNVRPGDVITYYAKARDVGRGKRSTEAKSDIFFLEVKPFTEEFVAAQSQASGGGGDPQLESLIQAQKDVISATWNIERRSTGGRSAEDVKAIAKAQADLKARVEALASGRGRRGRGFPQRTQLPPPRQRPAGGDPVAAAVEAMTRAIEQLASERTREAIPHEMAALNGLLQAQAEVRRREVSQQARGSGSGGGNRQSQDLSALFDKELQRQQRTNYEQRSEIEERKDEQASNQDSLDRIRDLARRQEELNRRQQELATGNAEERKRQLEKLAREQQELQRQAEELSREMGRQQGQSQGQQSQGNAGMRQAAEQMKQAASGMNRQDGQAAAQSGQRAAEQLRNLEQQLRGGGADARQRAAADLQAEAQQIAQEQRRIASDAERLEKSNEKSPDAGRRLAADKDRLADRVDSLKREAQRLGAGPASPQKSEKASGEGSPQNEQARAREAAGDLERQRVAERMRDSAQQLRDGAKSPSGQAEQQIAKALEQVVEKLGGASSAEARSLAEQLDRSRETRDRLDRLEAQMQQAGSKADGQLGKLQQQYAQELARATAGLGGQAGRAEQQRDGARGATPEEQQYSRSAPGTEAFKQDRSGWASLRKAIDRALEAQDADVSRRLAKAIGEDRLNAGGSDRVPEHYRRLVAKYYESLARMKK